MVEMMGPVDTSIRFEKSGPTILMLCGLQGSGKTTTIGKLGRLLASMGRKPLLVAADLQRPAAVEQLRVIGQQLGLPVFSESGSRCRGRRAAALGDEGFWLAFEVGEGDAVDGEGGDFVVVEEVDVAGVVENAGDVGGEEELAVAEAEDDGRAHAGGDHLVGLVGGEDADGEGAGHAFDGSSDGLFEGE